MREMAGTFFDRIKGPARQVEEEDKQPYWSPPPIERFLDWLINSWTKDTITLREICTYGPYAFRNKYLIPHLARTLERRGWLVPLKTKQHNTRKWRIARGPQPDRTTQARRLCKTLNILI
jgi:hypothetical protein